MLGELQRRRVRRPEVVEVWDLVRDIKQHNNVDLRLMI